MSELKISRNIPSIEQLRGRTIGRILVKMRALTRNQVHDCLKIQKERNGKDKLGQIMLELKLIDETQLNIALAAQRGMEYVDIDEIDIEPDVIEKVPAHTANAYHIVPITFDKSKNELTVVLDKAENFQATDDLSTLMGVTVKAKITDSDVLEKALEQYYKEEDEREGIDSLISEMQSDELLGEFEGRDQSIDLDELKELSESNPVKKLLNLVLLQAIRDKASDVHFEPFEQEYKMRYRIDGVLYEMVPPPRHIAAALSSRIKVMADLDIA